MIRDVVWAGERAPDMIRDVVWAGERAPGRFGKVAGAE
jgi:hypothetical protein